MIKEKLIRILFTVFVIPIIGFYVVNIYGNQLTPKVQLHPLVIVLGIAVASVTVYYCECNEHNYVKKKYLSESTKFNIKVILTAFFVWFITILILKLMNNFLNLLYGN